MEEMKRVNKELESVKRNKYQKIEELEEIVDKMSKE